MVELRHSKMCSFEDYPDLIEGADTKEPEKTNSRRAVNATRLLIAHHEARAGNTREPHRERYRMQRS